MCKKKRPTIKPLVRRDWVLAGLVTSISNDTPQPPSGDEDTDAAHAAPGETEAKRFEKVEPQEEKEYEMVDMNEDESFQKIEKEGAEMGDWQKI